MALRTDYPYEEALDDIKDFFQRKVKNKQSKKKWLITWIYVGKKKSHIQIYL
jgi:hypothetical protein